MRNIYVIFVHSHRRHNYKPLIGYPFNSTVQIAVGWFSVIHTECNRVSTRAIDATSIEQGICLFANREIAVSEISLGYAFCVVRIPGSVVRLSYDRRHIPNRINVIDFKIIPLGILAIFLATKCKCFYFAVTVTAA